MSNDINAAKAALIAKIIENTCNDEIDDMLSRFNLDIHQIVEEAVESKLNTMSFEDLLEYL